MSLFVKFPSGPLQPLSQNTQCTGITKIYSGPFHAIIDSKNGFFAYGSNISSQLSVPEKNGEILRELYKIRHLRKENVKMIVCGADFSAVVWKDGKVGISGYCKGIVPNKLAVFSRIGRDSNDHRREESHKPIVEGIAFAAAGDEHLLLVTQDGRLLVGGCNASGALGLNSEKDYEPLQPNPFFKGKKIKSVACGASHSIVLTKDPPNCVYVFGRNEGQCGYTEKRSNDEGSVPIVVLKGLLSPQRLMYTKMLEENIKVVACGANHTIVLTEEDHVWAAGSGKRYQLGFPDTKSRVQFTKVTHLSKTNILDVKCCDDVTIFVENGRIVFCGEQFGKYGQNVEIINSKYIIDVAAQYDRALIVKKNF